MHTSPKGSTGFKLNKTIILIYAQVVHTTGNLAL